MPGGSRRRGIGQTGREGARRAPKESSAEEEERLLEAAGQGDRQACERLTEAHVDWVRAAARERSDRGLSEADLFQEGSIGLIEAIRGFRASGASSFEAFARMRVGQAMDTALGEEERVVDDQRRLLVAADDYVRVEVLLRRELGRDPTESELAEKLEWSVQRTAEIGLMVAEAKRRHDEELLQYLEPDDIEDIEDRNGSDGEAGG
jgi:RNA polymerase primary sigma factor